MTPEILEGILFDTLRPHISHKIFMHLNPWRDFNEFKQSLSNAFYLYEVCTKP